MAEPKPNSSEQFRKTVHHLRQDMQELGKLTKDAAHDTLVHMREHADEYYKEGLDKAQHMEKNLETKIQQHPMRSVLIAASIGFVLGAIFKKK